MNLCGSGSLTHDESGSLFEDFNAHEGRNNHHKRMVDANLAGLGAEASPDGDDLDCGVTGCNRSALSLKGMSTVCGLCEKELPPEAFGTRAKGYRNTYCISCHRLRARARRRGIDVNELRKFIKDVKGGADDGTGHLYDRGDDSDDGDWRGHPCPEPNP